MEAQEIIISAIVVYIINHSLQYKGHSATKYPNTSMYINGCLKPEYKHFYMATHAHIKPFYTDTYVVALQNCVTILCTLHCTRILYI